VKPTRDFLYVIDTVREFIEIAENVKKLFGETSSLGTGIEMSIQSIAKTNR
jgi:nucleoside-diphosphate-sugar epimerase